METKGRARTLELKKNSHFFEREAAPRLRYSSPAQNLLTSGYSVPEASSLDTSIAEAGEAEGRGCRLRRAGAVLIRAIDLDH